MISDETLRSQLDNTLDSTNFPELGKKYEGKVRDNYTKDDRRIIITTDRISAFDRVLCSIPFKGQILSTMTSFWFDRTKEIVKSHMIDAPDPNVVVVREAKALPVEMVIREYITGVTTTSIWYNYQKGVRNFCGNPLPEGLKKDQKLDEPIVTPSTKADKGEHDESISPDEIYKRGLLSEDDFKKLSRISLELFETGRDIAAKQGVILVDTKYEFGRIGDEIILIDEIHTPDSSRFWFADTYQELFDKGEEQRKIDKEYIRTWLADKGFTGDGDIPQITDEIKVETAKRYIEAYENITGEEFKITKEDVNERIRRNLMEAGYLT